MKTDIHPVYHQAKVSCACGNNFVVGSTETEIKVEICSNCHPFYTGTAKLLDTAGRVDKFQARLQKQAAMQSKAQPKAPRKSQATAETKDEKSTDSSEATATPEVTSATPETPNEANRS